MNVDGNLRGKLLPAATIGAVRFQLYRGLHRTLERAHGERDKVFIAHERMTGDRTRDLARAWSIVERELQYQWKCRMMERGFIRRDGKRVAKEEIPRLARMQVT